MLSLLSYPSFWASRSLLEYLYAHNEYLMSNLNGDLQEYAVYGNQTARMFGIKYADCLAYKESEYMGCDVINGYMHFLEETYNNGGKNKFFAHQFFINVIEDKATFEKVVSKWDVKKGWAKWEKLFFPLQHNKHWFLIVADKVKEEILVYDSLAHDNKHHLYGVKKTHRQNENKEGEFGSRHTAVKGQGSFSATTWWVELWLLYQLVCSPTSN
jgi:hypothetical protein